MPLTIRGQMLKRVPLLFSYLQVKTDADKIKGQYILTGSQHFLMLGGISQTLAGRIALFNLYPFSYEELKTVKKQSHNAPEQIWKGGYPRLYNSIQEHSAVYCGDELNAECVQRTSQAMLICHPPLEGYPAL